MPVAKAFLSIDVTVAGIYTSPVQEAKAFLPIFGTYFTQSTVIYAGTVILSPSAAAVTV